MSLEDVSKKVDQLRHKLITVYIRYWHTVGYMNQKKTPEQIEIATLLKEAHEAIDKLREEIHYLSKQD